LRRVAIVRALDTVSIGVGSWSCNDEADSIYLFGVMWIRDISNLLRPSLQSVLSLALHVQPCMEADGLSSWCHVNL
jgi:hypothetical protein